MSEFSIYYLIARMYSWAVLFIFIAFLAFKNIINNKNDKKSWIILTLFSVFAAYTHYFGAITAICIYLILLIYLIRNKKDEIKNWVLSTIAGIVLYIPWVFVLLGQLMKIKQDYWIPPVTLEYFFRFIGYYAYTENMMFYIVSIGFLIAIILIYRWESDNFAKKDQIIIISAFATYFGTIFIGIAVSDLFTPVIDERYLMPAAALIWLSISIILAKIKNKKLFIVTLALICLILLSGVANTFITFDQKYHDGIQQKEYFENIANNNNSVLIIGTQDDILFFLCCSTDVDTYCINESEVFGLDSQEIHRQYNYTDINESQIDEFISNNPDKDIYFLYWEETLVESPIESEITQFFMHFTKIK